MYKSFLALAASSSFLPAVVVANDACDICITATEDKDARPNTLSLTLEWNRLADESGVEAYVLYWGQDRDKIVKTRNSVTNYPMNNPAAKFQEMPRLETLITDVPTMSLELNAAEMLELHADEYKLGATYSEVNDKCASWVIIEAQDSTGKALYAGQWLIKDKWVSSNEVTDCVISQEFNSCPVVTDGLFFGQFDIVKFAKANVDGSAPTSCAEATDASPFGISRTFLSDIKDTTATVLTGRPEKLGTYFMCYCGADTAAQCMQPSEFTALANRINIRGPNPTVPVAYCISELGGAGGCNSYTIDPVTGQLPSPFSGTGLSPLDKFFFVEKEGAICGTAGTVPDPRINGGKTFGVIEKDGELHWEINAGDYPRTLYGTFIACYCSAFDAPSANSLTGDTDTTSCNDVEKEYLSTAYQLEIEDQVPPSLTIGAVVGIDHGVIINFMVDEPSDVVCSAQRTFSSPWAPPVNSEVVNSKAQIMNYLTPGQGDGIMIVDAVNQWQEFKIDNTGTLPTDPQRIRGGEEYLVNCWARDKAQSSRPNVTANSLSADDILATRKAVITGDEQAPVLSIKSATSAENTIYVLTELDEPATVRCLAQPVGYLSESAQTPQAAVPFPGETAADIALDATSTYNKLMSTEALERDFLDETRPGMWAINGLTPNRLYRVICLAQDGQSPPNVMTIDDAISASILVWTTSINSRTIQSLQTDEQMRADLFYRTYGSEVLRAGQYSPIQMPVVFTELIDENNTVIEQIKVPESDIPKTDASYIGNFKRSEIDSFTDLSKFGLSEGVARAQRLLKHFDANNDNLLNYEEAYRAQLDILTKNWGTSGKDSRSQWITLSELMGAPTSGWTKEEFRKWVGGRGSVMTQVIPRILKANQRRKAQGLEIVLDVEIELIQEPVNCTNATAGDGDAVDVNATECADGTTTTVDADAISGASYHSQQTPPSLSARVLSEEAAEEPLWQIMDKVFDDFDVAPADGQLNLVEMLSFELRIVEAAYDVIWYDNCEQSDVDPALGFTAEQWFKVYEFSIDAYFARSFDPTQENICYEYYDKRTYCPVTERCLGSICVSDSGDDRKNCDLVCEAECKLTDYFTEDTQDKLLSQLNFKKAPFHNVHNDFCTNIEQPYVHIGVWNSTALTIFIAILAVLSMVLTVFQEACLLQVADMAMWNPDGDSSEKKKSGPKKSIKQVLGDNIPFLRFLSRPHKVVGRWVDEEGQVWKISDWQSATAKDQVSVTAPKKAKLHAENINNAIVKQQPKDDRMSLKSLISMKSAVAEFGAGSKDTLKECWENLPCVKLCQSEGKINVQGKKNKVEDKADRKIYMEVPYQDGWPSDHVYVCKDASVIRGLKTTHLSNNMLMFSNGVVLARDFYNRWITYLAFPVSMGVLIGVSVLFQHWAVIVFVAIGIVMAIIAKKIGDPDGNTESEGYEQIADNLSILIPIMQLLSTVFAQREFSLFYGTVWFGMYIFIQLAQVLGNVWSRNAAFRTAGREELSLDPMTGKMTSDAKEFVEDTLFQEFLLFVGHMALQAWRLATIWFGVIGVLQEWPIALDRRFDEDLNSIPTYSFCSGMAWICVIACSCGAFIGAYYRGMMVDSGPYQINDLDPLIDDDDDEEGRFSDLKVLEQGKRAIVPLPDHIMDKINHVSMEEASAMLALAYYEKVTPTDVCWLRLARGMIKTSVMLAHRGRKLKDWLKSDTARVEVKLIEGYHLPKADVVGRCDPFVEVRLVKGGDGVRPPLESTKLLDVSDSLAAGRSTVVYNTFYPKWKPDQGGCKLKLSDVQIVGDLNEAKLEEQPLDVQLQRALEDGRDTSALRRKLEAFNKVEAEINALWDEYDAKDESGEGEDEDDWREKLCEQIEAKRDEQDKIWKPPENEIYLHVVLFDFDLLDANDALGHNAFPLKKIVDSTLENNGPTKTAVSLQNFIFQKDEYDLENTRLIMELGAYHIQKRRIRTLMAEMVDMSEGSATEIYDLVYLLNKVPSNSASSNSRSRLQPSDSELKDGLKRLKEFLTTESAKATSAIQELDHVYQSCSIPDEISGDEWIEKLAPLPPQSLNDILGKGCGLVTVTGKRMSDFHLKSIWQNVEGMRPNVRRLAELLGASDTDGVGAAAEETYTENVLAQYRLNKLKELRMSEWDTSVFQLPAQDQGLRFYEARQKKRKVMRWDREELLRVEEDEEARTCVEKIKSTLRFKKKKAADYAKTEGASIEMSRNIHAVDHSKNFEYAGTRKSQFISSSHGNDSEQYEHKPISEELASVLWDLRRDRDDLVGELIAFSMLARDAYKAVSLMESNLKVHVSKIDETSDAKVSLLHCKRIAQILSELCMVEAFDFEKEKKEVHRVKHEGSGRASLKVERTESDTANLPKLIVKFDEYLERTAELYHNFQAGKAGAEESLKAHGIKVFKHFQAIRKRLFDLKVVVWASERSRNDVKNGAKLSPTTPGSSGKSVLDIQIENVSQALDDWVRNLDGYSKHGDISDLPVVLNALADVRGVENSISLAVMPLLNNVRELSLQTQLFHKITENLINDLSKTLQSNSPIDAATAARYIRVLDDYLHEAVDPICGLSQGTESIFYIIKDTIFDRGVETVFNQILDKPNELLIHLDENDSFKEVTGLKREDTTNEGGKSGRLRNILTGRSGGNKTPREGETPRGGMTPRTARSGDRTPRTGRSGGGETPRSGGESARGSMSARNFIGDEGDGERKSARNSRLSKAGSSSRLGRPGSSEASSRSAYVPPKPLKPPAPPPKDDSEYDS